MGPPCAPLSASQPSLAAPRVVVSGAAVYEALRLAGDDRQRRPLAG
jgi:hypothetical protein